MPTRRVGTQGEELTAMRHAAPGLTPGLRIPMRIVVENKAFLGRTRNSEHRIPARNALQSEKCADFSAARFLGCLPALQPVQLAIRVAKPPPVPSPRAWPLTSAPAIAARLAPTETPQARRENYPNIHRILPGDPPPGTTRILLEYCPTAARKPTRILREYLANTSRAPSGPLRVCMRFL